MNFASLSIASQSLNVVLELATSTIAVVQPFFPAFASHFCFLEGKRLLLLLKKLILLPRNSRIKPLKTRLFFRQQSTNYENVASLSAFCVFLNYQTRTRTDIGEKVNRMTILRG